MYLKGIAGLHFQQINAYAVLSHKIDLTGFLAVKIIKMEAVAF